MRSYNYLLFFVAHDLHRSRRFPSHFTCLSDNMFGLIAGSDIKRIPSAGTPLIVRSVVWSFGATIDLRSVVGRNDWSHDAMIDRRVPRLIIRSVIGCQEWSHDRSHAGCHDCSYERSQDATIDRTISHRPSRLLVRSVATIDRTNVRRA